MDQTTFSARFTVQNHWKLFRARLDGLSPRLVVLAVTGVALLGGASATQGFQDETETGSATIKDVVDWPIQIDEAADALLRKMSDHLGAAKAFSFHAEVANDVMLSHGQMVQIGGESDIVLRRPGQVQATYNGDERRTRTYLNNGSLTIHNAVANVYAATEVPEDIDGAIDFIFERLGFSVPIADLLYSDVYATLTENVRTGYVVGEHPIDGTPCTHLAFSQELIDWEIWISSGGDPVPRKVVIRYKDEQGSPQYTAKLSDWNFKPNISSNQFVFTAPEGADQIEFLPIPENER